jgi:hypothetical protein
MNEIKEAIANITRLETLLNKEMEEFVEVQKDLLAMGIDNIAKAEKEFVDQIEDKVALLKELNATLIAKIEEYGSAIRKAS